MEVRGKRSDCKSKNPKGLAFHLCNLTSHFEPYFVLTCVICRSG